MIALTTDSDAEQVTLDLSVRRAREKPAGIGTMLPLKSGTRHRLSVLGKGALPRGWVLPPQDAGQFFPVTESDLATWRKDGAGPFYLSYPNGAVRYCLEDLVAWLADGFHEGGESWERLGAAGALSNTVDHRNGE